MGPYACCLVQASSLGRCPFAIDREGATGFGTIMWQGELKSEGQCVHMGLSGGGAGKRCIMESKCGMECSDRGEEYQLLGVWLWIKRGRDSPKRVHMWPWGEGRQRGCGRGIHCLGMIIWGQRGSQGRADVVMYEGIGNGIQDS